MSNILCVRRVIVQTIDERGRPVNEPTYGVMAADAYAQSYNDTFRTLAELNSAIRESGSILTVVDDGTLFGVDPEKIGTDNYCGPWP